MGIKILGRFESAAVDGIIAEDTAIEITETIDEKVVKKTLRDKLKDHEDRIANITVPDWAKEDTKPSYTAEEVGALPDTTKVYTESEIKDIVDEKLADKDFANEGYVDQEIRLALSEEDYADLTTTNKTIIGAINEINSKEGGGTGGDSITGTLTSDYIQFTEDDLAEITVDGENHYALVFDKNTTVLGVFKDGYEIGVQFHYENNALYIDVGDTKEGDYYVRVLSGSVVSGDGVSADLLATKQDKLIMSTENDWALNNGIYGFLDMKIGTKTLRILWGKTESSGTATKLDVSYPKPYGKGFKAVYQVSATCEQQDTSKVFDYYGMAIVAPHNEGFRACFENLKAWRVRYIVIGRVE